MGLSISVVATGVIALSLALAAMLYLAGAAIPSLQVEGDKFFALALFLVIMTILLSVAGAKLKFH